MQAKGDDTMSDVKNNKFLKWGLWLTFGVILFWSACTVIILLPSQYYLFSIPQNICARGQLGDSFNIVTSFISSVTLVFLIVGVLYTHSQYKKLLEDSDDQKKAANKDSFENSLFRLLSMHNDVVNSIQIIKEDDNPALPAVKTHYAITGRECFKHFYEQLVFCYEQNKKPSELDRIIDAYEELYAHYGHHTGQYFRRLFNIIRFIDDQIQFTEKEKYEYARIIRAQLSNYEIKLLLYNSLTPKGDEFTDYIIRYKLLKGIAGEKLLDDSHWDFAKTHFDEFWK